MKQVLLLKRQLRSFDASLFMLYWSFLSSKWHFLWWRNTLVTWMLNCKCAVESNISLVEVSFPISVWKFISMPWWIAWKANQLYFRLSGDIAWNFIHKIEPSWMLDVKLLLTMHLFLKWWVCSKIKQYLYHNNWLNRMNKIETRLFWIKLNEG